jgi:hypothetical protein
MKVPRQAIAGLVGLCLAGATSTQANLSIGQQVTVAEIGQGPTGTLTISDAGISQTTVYAGIYRLRVNGQTMDSFCIDAYQWAPSSSGDPNYTVSNLADAPVNKPPGAMLGPNAAEIQTLWAHYYSPTMSNGDARLLQAAIWLLASDSSFTIYDAAPTGGTGRDAWLNWLTTDYEVHAGGGSANLVALTSTSLQDYVVATPDGGTTVALLGLAFSGMALARRKFQTS